MENGRRKRLAIACQGGGSHTAFTAGALQGLLGKLPADLDLVALTGTSGGALCATLAWDGLVRGDVAQSIDKLGRFWKSIAATEPMDRIANSAVMAMAGLRDLMVLPEVSPYHLPTTGEDHFRAILAQYFDFEELRRLARAPGAPILRIGAVEVLTGHFELFAGEDLCVECLLASAAIPEMFRAVTVPGRGVYWDGLFSQNPPIDDLIDKQIEEIGHWVSANPTWSRYRLSREFCTRWDWIRPNGQLADMAARSFLNKLHQRALIRLPPCRRASPNRMKHRRLGCVPLNSGPVEGDLGTLGPLHLHEVSQHPVRRAVFETLLATEHYLGYRSPVGENLKYPLCTEQDRPVCAWLFGAAAWRCEARDRWIGWNDRERAAGLQRLTNNTRFLIPRWVRVHGLASWGWSRVSRRLVRDWKAKYGHGLELVETFVDRSRFHGCSSR